MKYPALFVIVEKVAKLLQIIGGALRVKGKFYKGFIGHFPIIPLKNSMVKNWGATCTEPHHDRVISR